MAAIRIVQTVEPNMYDLRNVHIDLSRKTGVLIRQSRRGADIDSRESRLKQEGLVPLAVELRHESDRSNIILYDEGSGVSGTKGYDERPQLSRLYLDIANDVIGSIIVARADRLFRDKHFRNVSMFTELAEQKRIVVIVPNRAVYDFTKTRDLQSFQREMQDAYGYIATQIAYMLDTKAQKVQRGFYGGANIPAPYTIDKLVDKEHRLPIIYQPWLPIAVNLFERFRDFDFQLSRIARYIEDQPYIFPYPLAIDLQRYMFKTRMTRTAEGYTFVSADAVMKYFSNLSLGGFAKIGRDSEGNMLLLENAFEAAIPFELLAESYASITGQYPDGTRYERWRRVKQTQPSNEETSTALLRRFLRSNDGAVTYYTNFGRDKPYYSCQITGSIGGQARTGRTGILTTKKAWTLACEEVDSIVVNRLRDLSQHDTDMADRIKSAWEQRRSSQKSSKELLDEQYKRVDDQILHYDALLTNPAAPLSTEMQRRYINTVRELEIERDRVDKKRSELIQEGNPEDLLPNFYQVLSNVSSEYKKLSIQDQKKLVQKVIEDICIDILSPHVLLMRITWLTGMASCTDVALLWRGGTPNTGEEWTEQEDTILRDLYPCAAQLELLEALPKRGWNRIMERAQVLDIKRNIQRQGSTPINVYHRTMQYDDLCAADRLVDDPQQRARLREVINTLAKKTVRGGLSAYWWLPLDDISLAALQNKAIIQGLLPFNVGAIGEDSPGPIVEYDTNIRLRDIESAYSLLLELASRCAG